MFASECHSAGEIAHVLGKPRREGRAWRCVCPLHGGHSLVLRDGENALLVKCWGGNCEPEEILAELRRRGLIEARNREQRPLQPPLSQPSNRDDEHQHRQHEKARWLWSQRRPINETIAEKYLRGRGITCPLPPTLAFLPPNKPEHHPAMVAAFSVPDEIEPGVLGEPSKVGAVHLTLLRSDGSGKADIEHPKRFVGSPGNLPVVIAPANDLLGLAIAEGIEDALTAHQVTGLGAWAAGSAGRMPALADTLPGYIECVTIFAHSDLAGQDGALALAKALDRRGVEVFVEGLPRRQRTSTTPCATRAMTPPGNALIRPSVINRSNTAHPTTIPPPKVICPQSSCVPVSAISRLTPGWLR